MCINSHSFNKFLIVAFRGGQEVIVAEFEASTCRISKFNAELTICSSFKAVSSFLVTSSCLSVAGHGLANKLTEQK